MHWQDRLGAMAGVHDFQGTAVFSKLIFSPTRETWEQSHYRRAKHTIHITYLHIYTSWLYKIIQDYTRWFSQGFPKIFVVFSRFPNVFQLISLQDSELGYGLRRPSGYPIHDRADLGALPDRRSGCGRWLGGPWELPWELPAAKLWPWMPWHFWLK